MKVSDLKEMYEWACMKYVDAFCEKQGLMFYGWVGGRVGEVGQFCDYFLNLSEVMHDVNTEQPAGKILEWYDAQVEAKESSTYEAFTKGFVK